MHAHPEVQQPGQLDPKLLQRLFYVDHLCLFAVGIVALANIIPGIFIQIQTALPASWLDMGYPCAAMTLCAVTSLFLTEATQQEHWQRVGQIFGVLVIMIAGAFLWAGFSSAPKVFIQELHRNELSLRQGSLPFSTAAFLLIGVAVLLASSNQSTLGHIADGITVLLSLVSLILVVNSIFAVVGVVTPPTSKLMTDPTLLCFTLLTLVVVSRRGERGFLSILLGHGTGSRIARMLFPVLLLLPILREILRARLLNLHLIPAQYVWAVLTSTGTLVGIGLLLLLAQIVNRMENDVKNVTFRDELTGVYSLRGFYMLSEQAFQQSKRIGEKFGVLFVDMDNLKIINDRLGHSAGSVSIVETAKLLTTNFREIDIIGRVGGDEFVIAGQFNKSEMANTVERLREAMARKNQATGERFSISLSMGYAVTEDFAHDTLRSLVRRADEAMYKEKHAKKKLHSVMRTPNGVTQPMEVSR